MRISERVTVSKQFVSDFEAVATRYKLRELGEYEAARNIARNDLDSAIECFTSMANAIRKEHGKS